MNEGAGFGSPLLLMAKRLLDKDPLTGVETWFDYDHVKDSAVITEKQPVDHILKYCSDLRQISDERTKQQIKKDWVHYAILPATIQLEMKTKHGVDPWKKEDEAKRLALINSDYSKFKVTNIMHNVKRGG